MNINAHDDYIRTYNIYKEFIKIKNMYKFCNNN